MGQVMSTETTSNIPRPIPHTIPSEVVVPTWLVFTAMHLAGAVLREAPSEMIDDLARRTLDLVHDEVLR